MSGFDDVPLRVGMELINQQHFTSATEIMFSPPYFFATVLGF